MTMEVLSASTPLSSRPPWPPSSPFSFSIESFYNWAEEGRKENRMAFLCYMGI